MKPFCACLLSPVLIKCDNFNSFTQLDFTRLNQSSNEFTELELSPTVKLTLNNDLNLNGINVTEWIKLRNINGFDFTANPFRNTDNKLKFSIYESRIETVNAPKDCRSDSLTDDFVSLFSSFEIVIFSNDLTYTDNFCPLIFKNSSLRQLEIYYLTPENRLKFLDLPKGEKTTDFAQIDSIRIFNGKNIIIDSSFLNPHVFAGLKLVDIDYSTVSAIADDTFRPLANLGRVNFRIENYASFFRSSNNTWMAGLNAGVNVDYNSTESIQSNQKNAFLFIFDSRYDAGEFYDFPSEDLQHFQFFPHQQFVLAYFYPSLNLNCSDTIKFLYKNLEFYDPYNQLNQVLGYRCTYGQDPTTAEQPTSSTTTQG
jgi:hypothetical protein